MKSTRMALTVVAALAFAADIGAQAPMRFDVVSIKPNTSGEQGGTSRAQPGRYQGVNVTLMRLIRLAYRPIQEFEGGPDWINTEHFDVEAKAEGTPTQDQMLTMLRTMLAERFGLQVRQETRERPIYALTLARRDGKLGAQLKPADASCPGGPGTCGVQMGDNALSSRSITMARLAGELSFVGRKVVDRTGLTGAFDVNLQWTPDSPGGAPTDGNLPSIFTALQEQLGLKLEPTTGPVDVLVIVRAERPTAN
jgi:uncharacterized protein (TIGR03435 family)